MTEKTRSVFSIYRLFLLFSFSFYPPYHLLFSQTPVPFTKPLHVVFIRGGGTVAVVLCGSTGAARSRSAEAAEQTSSN